MNKFVYIISINKQIMNIKINENCVLENPGVYFIVNLINGKKYIGSSTMKIVKRMTHHYTELKRNNHKNTHLQNAWNLYGEDNFVFEVVINLEKNKCLETEQIYIDSYKLEDIYNINPSASGTPNMSLETIEKRNKSITIFREKALEYFYLLKGKVIKFEAIPEKYRKYVDSRINQKSWNKGKTKENTDFSYLKGIKKTNTQKRVDSRKNIQKKQRETSGEVYVYNKNMKFIGYWSSFYLLAEDSLLKNFKLIPHMQLRNPTGRNGYGPFELQIFNMQKSVKKGIPYKGLYFNSKPLHEVIHVE